MTYILEFELPGLPKSPNGSHGMWQQDYAERKKWRNAASQVAYFRRPAEPLQAAKLTLTRCSSSEPDFDNLAASFKPLVDGLKDAGVIVDDKNSVIKERHYLWEKVAPKAGKVRIRVEEVPNNQGESNGSSEDAT